MAIFRSFNDIVISWLEFLRVVQPKLDTKPGTASRDLFIDAPAQQLANLYNELRNISKLQSYFSANGRDLDRLASNFGVTRSQGSVAAGVAVLTTNNLDNDILIPQGSVLVANNGISFQTTTSNILRSSSINLYRSTASRLRTELILSGISDEFAIEVSIQALTAGNSGNIGKFTLTSHNISGISNVTNLQTFSGGTNIESDTVFRNRVLSIFAGSNTGTSLGYETVISSVSGVLDSLVIVPGDPLLIRDGTQVVTDSDGNLIVSEPGSGGKVDIYVLGDQLQSQIDSFIYQDQSGLGDATETSNDFILGQRGESSETPTSQRRVELINSNTLPFQPVRGITSVIGSSSGPNFVEEYVDENGKTRGNYKLTKDTGDFGGSAFGFDKLQWSSNQIELEGEENVKGSFNGSDALSFSDVDEIRSITRDVFVVNENSTTSSTNRNNITLLHTPVKSVGRVVNLTTGERYTVTNQNPDGGSLNTTGNITISGNTLPVKSDILQVDYTWIKSFDKNLDFDNLKDYNEFRTTQDSADWSFGNMVKYEETTIIEEASVNTIEVTHNISKILSILTYEEENATVSSGSITLSQAVTNILDIKRVSDNAEMFNADARDGSVFGTASVLLPTDTLASSGDSVAVRFNTTDISEPDGYDLATFNDNIITLAPGFVLPNGTSVLVSYIADINTLVPEINLTSLPLLSSGNKFTSGSTLLGDQPTSNIYTSDTPTYNLRQAASNLRVTAASIGSNGSVIITGTSQKLLTDSLVVVTSGSGLEIDLQTAIKNDLGVSTLSSNIQVSRVVKVEKVSVDINNLVSSVDFVFDIKNYKLKNNTLNLDDSLSDSTLSATKIELPATTNNNDNLLTTGDIVRVSFYYSTTADTESLFFSRNGTLITNKVFHSISRLSIGSGFQNSSGVITGTISVSNFNQPLLNTTYNVDYNYIAPKEGERITITFNYNKLITDTTLEVEGSRPITADVLIKAAKAKTVDANIKIVLLPEYVGQEQTVIQNAVDAVSGFLNSDSLGSTIDQSDIINILYTVGGVDRVTILSFSSDSSGNKLSISAQRNEFLEAGIITVEVEER